MVDLLDERFDEFDETSALDPGMAGAVAALTAIGATTITSCHGRVLGARYYSDAPTVLFSCPTQLLPAVDAAAAAVDCGLVGNLGVVE